MSSSRSIAAARNRRAGGEQQQQQINRPGTSIAGQPAFSQQQQLKRNLTAPNSTPNVPVTTNSNPKLSISDAIGLITLRLGRVEQILIDAEQNGGLGNGSSIPDNTHLVDKSVINSIVNRLDSLEKRDKETSSNQQTSKLEIEIRDIKDLLMSQILKYEKFTSETNKNLDLLNNTVNELNETVEEHKKTFDDFDQAIVEIEKKQELMGIDFIIKQNNDDCVLSNDDVNKSIFISNNLKSTIEEELSDSTL